MSQLFLTSGKTLNLFYDFFWTSGCSDAPKTNLEVCWSLTILPASLDCEIHLASTKFAVLHKTLLTFNKVLLGCFWIFESPWSFKTFSELKRSKLTESLQNILNFSIVYCICANSDEVLQNYIHITLNITLYCHDFFYRFEVLYFGRPARQ